MHERLNPEAGDTIEAALVVSVYWKGTGDLSFVLAVSYFSGQVCEFSTELLPCHLVRHNWCFVGKHWKVSDNNRYKFSIS